MNRSISTALTLAAVLSASAALAQSGTTSTTTTTTQAAPAMVMAVTSDASTKTVKVNLMSGMGTANGGLNYNGDSKGDKTLTVPLGWTVEVMLGNSGRMPHNALVFAGSAVPATIDPSKVAFKGAATAVVGPGQTPVSTSFVASRPGSYVLLCGVGRHAANGMWIKMTVANGIKEASYK
ncbi:sulfocyanin-like copper-binding protein [Deinococcus pimensis]|uniref:sulfocyanin-like copper-binding protein n=1 Tax=Deinococcus pimensis TaxID=309888 RepID=UPI0004863369|nr:sulfocyanin-like copper-binding protein [Deinococcus pimensis]